MLDSDTVFDLTRVPETIAIIGGGYIGLEFACFFNEVGAKVSVYEMLPQIAAGCDREISSRLLQIMKRAGIEFHLSSKVLGIEGNTIRYAAADGSEASVSADCILNATGRAPVVEGLGLEEVGVDFSPQGREDLRSGQDQCPRRLGLRRRHRDGACWPMPPRAKASSP